MKYIRFAAMALSGAIILSVLAACGPGQAGEPASQKPSEFSGVAAASMAPTDPAVTLEPSGEPSPTVPQPEPTATPIPTATPVPATPAPAQGPKETPGEPSDAGTTIQVIWKELLAALGLADAGFVSLDAGTLADLYGMDAADLTAYTARMPMIGIEATEFFIAQVREGRMDAVKEAIASRQAALADEFDNYLPEQLELVEDYRLVIRGEYVMFCICKDADSAVAVFERHT